MPRRTSSHKADLGEVRHLVEQLTESDKLVLYDELRHELGRQRLADTIREIRARARRYPISAAEIRRECEAVRQELYEKRRGGRYGLPRPPRPRRRQARS
jgi:hypothetical protein